MAQGPHDRAAVWIESMELALEGDGHIERAKEELAIRLGVEREVVILWSGQREPITVRSHRQHEPRSYFVTTAKLPQELGRRMAGRAEARRLVGLLECDGRQVGPHAVGDG
jgi:hypothetical protein